ncbi:hypothetical protein, partial [Klebsiella quasipneumoniae]|uniref:hypothetical protein n=1 Tax=Klebsiella quasipneumoniae TaxID=1463165 RepID=UPI002731C2C5
AKFHRVEFLHLPREENQFADALSKLASLLNIPPGMQTIPIVVERSHEPAYVCDFEAEEEQNEPWYQAIINFKRDGEYPPNT